MTPARFVHYALGNEKHDREHYALFEGMNELVRLMLDGQSTQTQMEALLSNLSEHFVSETKYMQSIDYPFLGPHAVDHARMVSQLTRMVNTNATGMLLKSMAYDMEELFIQHIDYHDRPVSEYAINNKASSE